MYCNVTSGANYPRRAITPPGFSSTYYLTIIAYIIQAIHLGLGLRWAPDENRVLCPIPVAQTTASPSPL
jgi:hypothetical protein